MNGQHLQKHVPVSDRANNVFMFVRVRSCVNFGIDELLCHIITCQGRHNLFPEGRRGEVFLEALLSRWWHTKGSEEDVPER